MLGNFSFGDYFKENAIIHAWNLLTKDFQLPKEKLLVTVFHEDEESFKFWKKIAGLLWLKSNLSFSGLTKEPF